MTRRQKSGIVQRSISVSGFAICLGCARQRAEVFFFSGNLKKRFTRCRFVLGPFANVPRPAVKRIGLIFLEKALMRQKPALSSPLNPAARPAHRTD